MKLPWQKKEEDGKESIEVSLPKETADQLAKAVENGNKIASIEEKLKGLDSINAYFADKKAEDDAAKAAAARKQQQEHQEQTDTEIEELMLTDPKAAIAKATEPQKQLIFRLRADNLKRDVFENAEKFPYYAGDVKSEVDKLLAQQTIAAQNDPSVIENCYFSVMGRKSQELKEGKLKDRFAQASGSRGTNGGNIDGKGNESEALEINDDIRKAARVYGTTPEKYAEMVKEAGVGYV